MRPRLIHLVFSVLLACNGYASNLKVSDTLPKPGKILDSIVLSDKLDWSVRAVTNFKQQQFRLGNGESKLIYRPNNPFGIGFGIANQKIVIDIIFNIKGGEEDQTNKFAAEGSILFNKNMFSFMLENVHGYQVESLQHDEDIFRDDISAYSLGLEYLRILSKESFTVRDMKSGSTSNRRSFLAYGLGGFMILRGLHADGSIIPEKDRPYFNDQAQIYDLSTFGGGILAGVSSYFKLPANFFFTMYVAPGIGLEYKYVKTETENYVPSDPLIYKATIFGALGYNRKKFYIHATFGSNWYLTSMDHGNDIFLSVTKAKFIVGYRIGNLFKKK
ncbi:DUF4421 domain-containing protein [Lutimonas saemankumensis]|uniref:DUF4421 family protein n=1 Tax=Lutimonas saemankumensis TaxID=483016 RepID=UPI001CD65066|nr:DUF4421 family protein [Lutimonas saemankumensis]MCA0931680.1 DUF4421 domain-containing protein [Lutimonas saemankumensis]